VAPPEPFDGDTKKYRHFRRQCGMYIRDRKSKFDNNDERKIMFVLSYMKDGLAGAWADNIAREMEDIEKRRDEPLDFETFFERLDKAFTNTQEVKQAQADIERIYQGKQSAEEFFQKFENLRVLAGYTENHDGMLLRMLERKLEKEVTKQIALRIPAITTYEDYREIATILSNQLRDYNQTTPPPKQWNNNQQRFQQSSYKTPTTTTSTTHNGVQPMDVDRSKKPSSCFRCGDPNHMKKECPKQWFEVDCSKCGRKGHVERHCRGGYSKGAQGKISKIQELMLELEEEDKQVMIRGLTGLAKPELAATTQESSKD
jgi:hypothetical protein